jgi:hypothetical protein
VPVAQAQVPQPQAVPQQQYMPTRPAPLIKNRGIIVGMGMVVAALSFVGFLLSTVNDLFIIMVLEYGGDPNPLSFINNLSNFLNPAITVLLLGAFVVLGISMLSASSRLKVMGAPAKWCTMNGLADILVAAGLIFPLISTFVAMNGPRIIADRGMNPADFSALMFIIGLPAAVLGVAAGVIYVIAGVSQKAITKSNAILVIAGVALIVYAILSPMAGMLVSAFGNSIYIIASVPLLAARALRGFAAIGYPK